MFAKLSKTHRNVFGAGTPKKDKNIYRKKTYIYIVDINIIILLYTLYLVFRE